MTSRDRNGMGCRSLVDVGALVWSSLVWCIFSGLGVAEQPEVLVYNGYIDAQCAHDFNRPPTRYRSYSTQPYYTDEPALNLGYVDATLDHGKVTARLALQYGSSVVANYSAEPEVFARYVQEGKIGWQVTDTWSLEAGVFLSHIGMESWISRDNAVASRALISDYSPYYQSGVRSAHRITDELRFDAYLLRGWQNISGDRDPALGTQLEYAFNPQLTFLHNSFIGNEDGKRFFNDFVIRYRFSDRFGIDMSYDIGSQSRKDESRALWYGWAVVPRYTINETFSSAIRVEQYVDNHNVLVATETDEAFAATSISLNIDTTLAPRLILRNEYRVFFSSRDIFPRGEGFSSSDSFVMASLVYTLRGEK